MDVRMGTPVYILGSNLTRYMIWSFKIYCMALQLEYKSPSYLKKNSIHHALYAFLRG